MTARTHDWVNRGRWVVEVESRVMSSDAHLCVFNSKKVSVESCDVLYLFSRCEVYNLNRTPGLSFLSSPTVVDHYHLLHQLRLSQINNWSHK